VLLPRPAAAAIDTAVTAAIEAATAASAMLLPRPAATAIDTAVTAAITAATAARAITSPCCYCY